MDAEQRRAFFNEIHSIIERTSQKSAEGIAAGRAFIMYPPNDQFEVDEREALLTIAGAHPALAAALAKAIADACALSMFDMFNLIDGTGDPAHYDGFWGTFDIVPLSESHPFYHEEFFGSWWDWQSSRGVIGNT